jgi:RNA polymerase sigma-70 factor (ECF subfamily)
MGDDVSFVDMNELKQAAGGDQACWERVISHQQERLRRMVAFRMDSRLQGRIDPSDVLQESMLEAWQRLPEFVSDPAVPFFVWLRTLTQQRLGMLRRTHLERDKRTVNKEIQMPENDSSSAMAVVLVDSACSPSQTMQRKELFDQVQHKLNSMEALDREVLALRHFEQLGNAEVASVLGISEPAASLRYSRALRRLKDIIAEVKGMTGEFTV